MNIGMTRAENYTYVQRNIEGRSRNHCCRKKQ